MVKFLFHITMKPYCRIKKKKTTERSECIKYVKTKCHAHAFLTDINGKFSLILF